MASRLAIPVSACPQCDHSPYDPACEDPEFQPQPCCSLVVHVDDLGSNDPDDHLEECSRFVEHDDVDEFADVVRAAVRGLL